MKQLLQNLKNGETTVADIPCPMVQPGQILIRTRASLISAGTERMLVDFGKASLIDKARQQPDKVKMVFDKIRTDGLMPTLNAVRSKLDQPLPLGYCNVGVVIEVGAGVDGFKRGDRVASNGKHAEVVSVPVNLCTRIPDEVDDASATFTVIGAIALQGIRLIEPTLGEAVVVTGLGLIGLVAVQLLRAHGCRVLGIDFDPAKLAMARSFGAETVDLSIGEDPVARAQTFSRGRGVDAVLITASTKSNEPVHQAALMCRKRGRIVLVGVAGLELSRADFFEKELSFQVSCSYGPGRYDPAYEERGNDYPFGLVRWTEQRNFEAVLDMMADRRLDASPLISHRYALDQAQQAYQLISGDAPSLGVLLEYDAATAEAELRRPIVKASHEEPRRPALALPRQVTLGAIGAGNYAGQVLMPVFRKAGATLKTVVSNAGVSGAHAAKKFGFAQCASNAEAVFSDTGINVVVVATRHDSHAGYVLDALRSGKHVFVEKPLALTHDEIDQIEQAYEASRSQAASGGAAAPLLMVGFNRRFSPQILKIKQLVDTVSQPKVFSMTVNAGHIPENHWTQDRRIGGGRIIGEACHFVDLLCHLAGTGIADFQVQGIGSASMAAAPPDTVCITIKFTDGSMGVIQYLANGHKSFRKERLEVFCAGRILQLDNFRKLAAYGWPGFSKMNLWSQDKGQEECARRFVAAVSAGADSPIPASDIFAVARVCIDIASRLEGQARPA